MADEQSRNLQRAAAQGDVEAGAKLLLNRVRSGDLSELRLQLGARLGHAGARVHCSDQALVRWEEHNGYEKVDANRAAAYLLGKTLLARVSADWAERTLNEWSREFPGDRRPHEAIEAARAWALHPCDEHSNAAFESVQIEAAWELAFVPVSAESWKARAAYSAAAASANAAAAYHSRVALEEAECEASVEEGDAHHMRRYPEFAEDEAASAFAAVLAAGQASSSSAFAASDKVGELEWQRLRLAAYVLGEVE
tara:strand:- start:1121 stop:1879 length:759 start_codon:yes stop_codon:yes gene_type:complete